MLSDFFRSVLFEEPVALAVLVYMLILNIVFTFFCPANRIGKRQNYTRLVNKLKQDKTDNGTEEKDSKVHVDSFVEENMAKDEKQKND